jgi:hypothetical protein
MSVIVLHPTLIACVAAARSSLAFDPELLCKEKNPQIKAQIPGKEETYKRAHKLENNLSNPLIWIHLSGSMLLKTSSASIRALNLQGPCILAVLQKILSHFLH